MNTAAIEAEVRSIAEPIWKEHDRSVRRAMKLAEKASHTFAFHGVIVTKGGAVKAMGYNHHRIHAEINALKQLWPSERKGTRVLSIRVSRTGTLAMAKPCPACMEFMREHGIKQVWYSTSEGQIERMKL